MAKKTSDDTIKDALDRFTESQSGSKQNRQNAYDDIKFSRLGDQWPDAIKKLRKEEGRPCLTINRLPAFVRQVVNDSRQNKPGIKVSPVDSGADVHTAQVIGGLIHSIERSSNADLAYDTAIDHAVSGGFGFFRIEIDYVHDRSFDLHARIERIPNPLMVHWDVSSTEYDASDWDYAFVSDLLTQEQFRRCYPKASAVSFDSDSRDIAALWLCDDKVRLAEYWLRTEAQKTLYLLSNGVAVIEDELPRMAAGLLGIGDISADDAMAVLSEMGLSVARERQTSVHEVTRRIISGVEVLSEDKWPGSTIPICPVWGEEVYLDDRRHFRSMIRDAKDPQTMFNFWRHLALDTPIPTPSGWSTMGAIRVGDQLFDENGAICNVIGKSPVNIGLDCYRVKFDDGSSIVASDSHVWQVEERGKRVSAGQTWTIRKVTTEELKPNKHFIWAAKPLDCAEAELPVHPYLLGLWLGDGDVSGSRITPGDEDIDEVRDILVALGYRLGVVNRRGGSHGTFGVFGIRRALSDLRLLGNKHIPAAYLRASAEQRWHLLQGLMDSDGSISRANRGCSFVTTNGAIADGFSELLRSLGIKAVSMVREGRHSKLVGADSVLRPFTQFSFSCYPDEPAFRLTRKRAIRDGLGTEHRRRTKRHRIVSVERIPSVPVQCVGIDAPSHLFLAGESMVPTHNSASTELVAIAPRAPWIGPRGFVPKGQEARWQTANTRSHAYLEYEGQVSPRREPFAGVPAGAIQEALNASDDMKAITGIYDSSLGERSNETSGKAILARQRESDVSNFHFIDNLARAIQYAGRVLVEIIPSVYSTRETIRILGEDMKPQVVQLTQESVDPAAEPGPDGQPRLYNLATGTYDVSVSTGPSYATQREETREVLIEIMRQVPGSAQYIGDILLENMDFVGADKVAARLRALLPPQVTGQPMPGQQAPGQPAQPGQPSPLPAIQ